MNLAAFCFQIGLLLGPGILTLGDVKRAKGKGQRRSSAQWMDDMPWLRGLREP